MIHDVVTDNDVKTLISKRQPLTKGSNCQCCSLPLWKQTTVTHGQWVYSNSMLRSKIENQTMSAASNFDYSRILINWLERFEQVAYAFCGEVHRQTKFTLETRN